MIKMEQTLSSAVQHLNINSEPSETVLEEKDAASFRKNNITNQPRRLRKGNDLRAATKGQDEERDYIPTAIVIKNIPFSIKRELLLDIFEHLGLPIPFALNYHLDNGVFRGLAFANFHTPEETAVVVNSIKGIEICGRKLRVEYKKYIGSEKRDEAPQNPPPAIPKSEPAFEPAPRDDGFDFNDLQTRVFYDQIASFFEDHSRAALIYPPSLDPTQRKLIHGLAERFGLYHFSEGTGDERHIRVSKTKPQPSQTASSPRKVAPRRNGGSNSDKLYDSEPSRSGPPKPFKKMPKPSDSLAVYPIRQPRIPDLKNNFAARKKIN